MQRHQLYLIQLFITFTAFHHVAQSKARYHLRQRHRLINISAFQHFCHPLKQRVDVFHPHFGGFRTAGGFEQPAFVVDAADQIAHRIHGFTFSELDNLIQPVGEALQMLQTTAT